MFALLLASLAIAADPVASPSVVLATQGGARVSLDDIDAFAATIPEEQRAGYFNSPSRIETLVSGLLLQKQLAAEARELGLSADPTVKRQLEQAEDAALGKARMMNFRQTLKVPDLTQRAREEYIANREKYTQPESVRVKHVLIGFEGRDKPAAIALAERVRGEAVAHPASFDQLIKDYSDDPRKLSNHGVVEGAQDPARHPSAWVEAVANLKVPGAVSQPIETKQGLEIVQLVERTPSAVIPFDDVKRQIIAKLSSGFVTTEVQNHTDELRNRPLDVNAELLKTLRSRYGSDDSEASGRNLSAGEAN